MRFIVSLLLGYYDRNLFIEGTKIYKGKSSSGQDKDLDMTKRILKSSKEKPLKSIKYFFPKYFKERILKEQKDVLLNAIKLYDKKSKIIQLFEDKKY